MKTLRWQRLIVMCGALLAAFMALDIAELQAQNFKSCGPPPPAKPQRRTGGESFPPLPLPATPLRRTELKRPPSPPVLVGKVAYGEVHWVTKGGKKIAYRDWTTDPGDIATLLKWAGGQLGIRYSHIEVDLKKLPETPQEMPILYFTGHEAVSFTDRIRKRLRQFVLDGGYIWGDACCGSPDFAGSFPAEMKKVFPNRPLAPLEKDHPVWSCFYRIPEVEYQVEGKGRYRAAPELLGIDIGCRTAVLFTRYDLSCGWDGHTHKHGKRVLPGDARKIGANMLAYCLANYQLGRQLAVEKIYHQDKEPTRDELLFGQIIHDGDWDPHPSAVANLLKQAAASSTMNVQFKRVFVDLHKPQVFDHPILYITGHRNFSFDAQAVKHLRNYLANGGILLADSCCGRVAFDQAFRREMKKVLPKENLQPIPINHPLFTSLYPISKVEFSRFLRALSPVGDRPELEGISLGGVLAVVHSKYGLGTAWDGYERPYAKSYTTSDALKLGVNTLVYALTH